MRLQALLVLITAIAAPLGALAECGGFSIEAEGLYLQPLYCDFHYATATIDTTGEQRARSVKGSFDWGFRVRGSLKTHACSTWTLSYTRFIGVAQSCYVRSGLINTSPLVVAGITGVDQYVADAVVNTRYQTVDLRLTQKLSKASLQLEAFAHVQWLDLRQREQVRSIRKVIRENFFGQFFDQTAKFNGGAIGAGLGASVHVWQGVRLRGEFGAMGAVGEQSMPNNRSLQDLTNAFERRNLSRICAVPGIQARGAIYCAQPLGCVDVRVEVGYELTHYWRIIRAMVPVLGSTATGNFQCFDLGFAGPYIELNVRY